MAGDGTVRVRTEGSRGAVSTEEILDDMEGAAMINYSTNYAVYVEFPTSYTSSPPPFQPIYDWVDRKWGDLDAGLKSSVIPKGSSADAMSTEEQQRRVAAKIQWAIFHNGTDGVYFAHRALEKGESKAPSVLAQFEGSGDPKANEKALAEIVNGMFRESQRIVREEATDTGNLLQSGSIEWFESADDLPEKDPAEGGGR
ncbi:hypothetical protein M197_gp43 [Haloarcula hispanica tailed virus 2]|uniref:Uncharacterized protein n=1 Tax=Haloarcula hispanica tailed virus 2 TaxID=1273751 RepID=R4TM17_9CAUD|nr:hypothetical protein M197_gp43 [Haloarcula hispanica tailed virus 2]AGM11208.1 hypothetical protein HHTV2_43 [Haloarcula hispanica tailed virus 2]